MRVHRPDSTPLCYGPDQFGTPRVATASVFTQWGYDTNTNDRRLPSINDSRQRQFLYTTSAEALIEEVKGEDGSGNLIEGWKYGYDSANRLTGANSSLSGTSERLRGLAGPIGSTPGPGARGLPVVSALSNPASAQFNPLGLVDPAANLYAYARANPITYTDTLGLSLVRAQARESFVNLVKLMFKRHDDGGIVRSRARPLWTLENLQLPLDGVARFD